MRTTAPVCSLHEALWLRKQERAVMESLLCGVVQSCLFAAVLNVGLSCAHCESKMVKGDWTIYHLCIVHTHTRGVASCTLDSPPCANNALITSGFSHTVAQWSGVRLSIHHYHSLCWSVSYTYPLMSMSFTEVGLTALIRLTAFAQPYLRNAIIRYCLL